MYHTEFQLVSMYDLLLKHIYVSLANEASACYY